MAKVHDIIKRFGSVALVAIGWACFVVGAVVDLPIWLQVTVLSVARVLP